MTIDKQALRISELEELNELLREKVKKLESDLWDKEQLRQVYSEKSFNLECKVRELEARNQKDFVWRGKEISRLNDEVDELKEKLPEHRCLLPAATVLCRVFCVSANHLGKPNRRLYGLRQEQPDSG